MASQNSRTRLRGFIAATAALLAATTCLLTSPTSAVADDRDPTDPGTHDTNIVGGVLATQVYPWMVKLKMVYGDTGKAAGCGGTMLSRDMVLTAEHCFDSSQYGDVTRITAYIGANHYRDGVVRTSNSSARWIKGSGPSNGDWGILKLDTPYDVPGGYPMLPVGAAYDTGPTYRALGWGKLASTDSGGVEDLRQVDLPYVADNLCTTNADAEICAGDYTNGGVDTCAGDSGGPLLKQVGASWVQVGVTSWGIGCGRARQPGHYTQMSTYVGTIVAGVSQLGGSPIRTTSNPNPTGTATATATATATTTATATATVTATTAPSGMLTNGVPVSVSGTAGSFNTYYIDVPSGASSLVVTTTSGSGDPDLYVRAGSAPTTTSYTCRSWAYGTNETCTITAPSAGRYYVSLNAYSSYSGVSLKASYVGGATVTTSPTSTVTSSPTSSPTDPLLSNGVPVSVPGGSAGAERFYAISLPSGASTLTVSMSGGSGDSDLYVRKGVRPTSSAFDCRSWNGGNTETCTLTSVPAGVVYVRVNGYTTFSGASLVARW